MATENIIQSKLKEVLERSHTNRWKKEVNVFPGRLNFACPICGDSQKVDTKKRGNIYFKNMRYKCFNCSASMPITQFFEQLNVKLDPNTFIEINQQIDEYKKLQPVTTALSDFQLDKILKLEDVANQLNSHPEFKLVDFKPVDKNSKVGKYLIEERKIKNTDHFYQAVYKPSAKYTTPVLVSLNMHQEYVIGIQIRNLNSNKDKRFYKIYSFEDLWNFFPDKEKLTNEDLTRYNKLSYCYNILNVDFDQPITLFEGYIDAIFFPNSIGLVGTNTDYSFLLDDALTTRFFFDNDKAGLKKTREMIQKGYSVFLWDKFLHDISKKSIDPDIMYYKLKIRMNDLNKIAQKVNNPYFKFKLENYFSKDVLDLINI